MSFAENIQKADLEFFHLVNRKWTHEYLEAVVPWLRYQQVWYPFYLALFVFAWTNFGKRGWWWVAGFFVTIGASDSISSRLIKYSVKRLRPCSDPEVLQTVTLRVPHCPGGYSFTSSHAANHFAMAMFIFVTLSPFFGRKTGWIFLWAALIAYAQVFVGVHYPIDVLAGAMVGCLVGAITGRYCRQQLPFQPLQAPHA